MDRRDGRSPDAPPWSILHIKDSVNRLKFKDRARLDINDWVSKGAAGGRLSLTDGGSTAHTLTDTNAFNEELELE